MKRILSSRRDHYLAKFSIFLITVALTAGMVGCVEPIFDKNLEIQTWYDLDAVRKNLGGHHRLMNDLDSNTDGYEELANSAADGGKGWEPIGIWSAPFTGSFDGQGHKITDLFIDRPSESNVGLFSFVAEAGVIKNVRVVDVAVAGHDGVGGLVGQNSGTVSNSYSSGNITGDDDVGSLVGENKGNVSDSHSTSSVTGDDGVGGLVGENTGTVSKSYSSGSVSGDEGVGGLVGKNTGTVSNKSYSTGSVNGKSYVGGLVGGNEKGTASNSYSTGNVSGESYVGGLVGCNYDESTVRDSYSTGNVSGDVGVGGLVGFNDKSTVSNSHYNYDEVLINGENIITTGALFGEDFEQWLTNGEFLDVNERLSQEDGYYVVNNVTDFKELLAFGQNSFLEFRLTNDLDLVNEPNFYIPYFAGEFNGNGHKISNLSFNFTFAYNVGLFGYLARGGIVTRVGVENVNITGASFVGGLVGANWEGTVTNSHSTGSVSGKSYVGGLVGCNYKESTVEKSYSSGSVSGESYVGGLVGDNEWTVITCHFTGNVTSKGSYIGGLVGWNGVEVSKSHSSGSVSGRLWVGGLVGRNGGDVSESYSTGSVSGHDDVGGLVGANDHTVEKSYSSGNVNGNNRRVGGLVGSNDGGLVSKCYSTGSVSGGLRVGGLVGQNKKYKDNDGTVNGSYSTGRVSGKENVGGLVGWNDGTVSSSFWDKDTSEQATSTGGTGKTTAEMKNISTFRQAGWVISEVDPSEPKPDSTWYILKGGVDYPFLSWQPV